MLIDVLSVMLTQQWNSLKMVYSDTRKHLSHKRKVQNALNPWHILNWKEKNNLWFALWFLLDEPVPTIINFWLVVLFITFLLLILARQNVYVSAVHEQLIHACAI